MLDGIKSNAWHIKQGNNISSSGKLYVLFNQHQPYVDQFLSQGRDMGWLSQTFGVPETTSNFLGVLQERSFPWWLREGGTREGLEFKSCCNSAFPRGFVRNRLLPAKSCEQWGGSSGQGASRCHCQAAEMDPRATAGWGHPAQAQVAAGTQGGNGQPGGGHWESCSAETAELWDCLSIPLPRDEKVQLLQGGNRSKECSQKLQVKVFRVRNCQVRIKCFNCTPAAKRS